MSRALGLALMLFAVAAHAETRRVAVVVGNNAGSREQPPLRFAEDDAGKFARTLVEVGQVSPDDLELLQGRSLADLQQAMSRARIRIAAYHAQADARVLLIFYFSGHSDGEALELGHDLLSYADLRTELQSTGAEVRLAVVDSCRSGGLLTKGGTRGPGFQIRLTDDLATSGQVLLTSSAADEVALESTEIRGSYFTHHLISGLRGAADSSGDGRVTLEEAYRYAFSHTVSATAQTEIGPQHPEFDVRLSGQGELVLSELSHPEGGLALPEGFERAIVTDLVRDEVLAELPANAGHSLAVAPGPYGLKLWRGGHPFAGRVEVAQGQVRAVRWEELAPAGETVAAKKGGDVELAQPASTAAAPVAPAPGGLELWAGLGATRGVANGLGAMPALQLGVRRSGDGGASLQLQLDTGRGPGFSETSFVLQAGYRFGTTLGPARLWLGGAAGGGFIVQSPDGGSLAGSPMALAGLEAGASVHVAGPVSLELAGAAPLAVLQRDGALAAALLPSGALRVLLAP